MMPCPAYGIREEMRQADRRCEKKKVEAFLKSIMISPFLNSRRVASEDI